MSRATFDAKAALARAATLVGAALLLSSCFVGIVLNDDEVNVLVFESDGRRQCEPAVVTPQQSARRLADGGVDVRDSSCAVLTNLAFPAVCGAPSGELVVHEIDQHQLDAAQRLGFSLVTTLRLGNGDPGYTIVACTSGP